MNSKRAMAQLLKHLRSVGITHLPAVQLPKPQPARRPAAAGRPAAASPVRSAGMASETPAIRNVDANSAAAVPRAYNALTPPRDLEASAAKRPAFHLLTEELLSESSTDPAARTTALCRLSEVVAACSRCEELATTRRQTVFGTGNPSARIMLIGEAPGADEDIQGQPFVGKAGQLLDRIIESSQLRREDLYICNILRCRPPGNRNPLPQEASNCREYLDVQIHVIQPEYIICLGTIAAQNLLNEKRPVGKLRGQFHEYRGAKVLCTYHPSYLLRYPAAKVQVWEDMKFFMKDLGVILK